MPDRFNLAKTYVVDRAVIEKVSRDDLLDNLLLDFLSELLSGDFLSVLSGNDNSVDTERNHSTTVLLVLNSDLGLGIGSEPREGAGATSDSHSSVQLVGKHDSEGHELLGLVGGITEHDTLVTGTNALEGTVVETLSNIRGLLLNSDKNVAGLVVEALGGVVITNLLNGLTDDLLVVDLGLGGNFTKDHDHTGLGRSLASNLGERILSQASIELKICIAWSELLFLVR